MIIPTFADVEIAADRLKGVARRTPLLHAEALDEAVGATVLVKAECLQRYGAFKFRGAYNRLAVMSAAERAAGVVAFSSGNHAAGVAGAARLFGVDATIVMPSDAPQTKLAQTRALGAEIVLYDRVRESREAIGVRLAEERGLTLVKPFDDPYVIAGQGTCGLEIAEDVATDIVAVPASGGGLVAGVALAVHARHPHARIFAVEPEGHDDLSRSLQSGRIEANAPGVRSICDALLVDRMGEIPFALARAHLAGAVTASDAAVRAAMRLAFHHLKVVVEPGGAAALAALLSGRLDAKGRTVVVVASGGNVDPAVFAAALAET
ncbi:MAG: pyridoxal-phosphate dependent enzyme [Alphaproteobacteria bacterium]|nr:pyridoxal-phosphate dependent enzyme [Alphaproteobacteria bacterium]